MVRAEQLGERRIRGEAAVEVRPHRDDDDGAAVGIGGRAGDRIHERRALGLRSGRP